MPELPEVQAHAQRLTRRYAGAVLSRFEPLGFTALKSVAPSPESAYGTAVTSVRRRGKHLLADFGDTTFVVHLMQGGRLKEDPKPGKKPRQGLARWCFADDRAWLLTEAGTERKAGVWVVDGDPLGQPPLDHLGPEADAVDAEQLAGLLRAHPMRVHGFLRDQRILAGLGRRLANEVCWRARRSPFAVTKRLADEADHWVAAIREAVAESLQVEVARDDMSASRERAGAVHNRTGEACPRCGDTVRAVEYNRYTVCYCATCQTGGKVLADNTTSKFLK